MSKPFDARALEQIDSVEASAAAYFSLLRSSRATPQDYSDFESWHARDEAHRIAWARVQREWDEAGAMRTDPRILAVRERALANRRARRAWRRPAVAAVFALLAVAGTLAYQRSDWFAGAPVEVAEADSGRVISTGIGQQMTFRMIDGSTVTANTASNLSVNETETRRNTTLRQGEAFFEVAKNPQKPFTVEAGGVTVTALGTAFAVRETGGAIAVTLVHGQVRVDMPAANGAPAQSAVLEPGHELVWQAGHYRMRAVDAERQLGWRTGMIHFDRQPLESAVAEINRYSPQQIVIASPALSARPISGSFHVGVTRGFLQGVEMAGIARVRSESPTRVELVSP